VRWCQCDPEHIFVHLHVHLETCLDYVRNRALLHVCRNLRKRLTKIEAAKEKKSKGGELTAEQEENVASEATLRDELRSLGETDV
jgi:hypothetical protein